MSLLIFVYVKLATLDARTLCRPIPRRVQFQEYGILLHQILRLSYKENEKGNLNSIEFKKKLHRSG